MANALIGFQNRVDFGLSLTTTSQINTLPVDNLLDQRLVKVWRTQTTTTAAVILDNGSAKTVQLVGLMNTNATAAATFQFRVSDADPTGASGEIYDSGTIAAGVVDPVYQTFIHVLSSEVMGRYMRLDITDSSLSFIEGGRLFMGPCWRPGIGLAFGMRRGYADPSRLETSLGGQVYIDRRPKARRFTLTFDFVTEAEMNAGLSEIDRLNSITEDVLFVLDPASSNLGRDSLWGLLSNQSGIAQPHHDTFRQSYTLTERL